LFRRRDQRGGGPGAGAEQTERQRPGRPFRARPVHGLEDASSEQRDVENVRAIACFRFREQVELEGSHAAPVQCLGHEGVAGAQTARATAVGEDHQPAGMLRDRQQPLEVLVADLDRARCIARRRDFHDCIPLVGIVSGSVWIPT